MKDAKQIKDMLNDRAGEVCQFLLPAGHVDGSKWTVGDIRNAPPSETGKAGSLNIEITGGKVGVFADFAESDCSGANLLDLWMRVRGCEFKLAITEAREWLGVPQEWRRESGATRKKAAPAAGLAGEYVALDPAGPVYAWLTVDRGIPAEVLELYRIGQSDNNEYVVYPSFDSEDKLVSLKFRHISEKGKQFVLPKGGQKLLFGIQAIGAEEQQVIITEGEQDALAWAAYGQAAVSVPFGAKWPGTDGKDPNDEWILHDYDWLEQFIVIFLGLDIDKHGVRATKALIPRMGRHRSKIITYPRDLKDANECLMKSVEDGEMFDALINAQDLDPENLKQPSDFRKEVWEQFWPVDGKEPGDDPPWKMPLKFRETESSLWHGFTKHGKTVGLDFCCMFFGLQNIKSCRASMEIPAKMTLKNSIRQILGKRKPEDEAEYDRVLAWMDTWCWIYDHVGQTSVDDLFDVFSYAAKKYGIKHFIIDSLMKLDINEEDHNEVKTFMNRLLDFAREFSVHVHLVAHDKKPDSKHPEERYWPDKYSVRGSAHMVDLAHNILCMWRNKKKERLVREAGDDRELLDELRESYDALFIVQGQRGGEGEEPIKQLWFDTGESWQFREDRGEEIRNFLEEVLEKGE